MFPLRKEIEDAFQAAAYLSVEVDLSKIDHEEVKKAVSDLGVYKDGTKLQDHVSTEAYSKITAFLKENEMPENSFDIFKPWLVQQQIMSIQSAKAGFKPESGIDQYLIDKANEAKKPIIALERSDAQFQLNNSYSDGLQERLLLQNLDPNSVIPPAPDVSTDYLTKIWKEGDYNALTESLKSFDRDLAMAEKMKNYLNSDHKETHLVVVGFGLF
ncbi:TraB/GumN family protein [Brevibacillus reuszeri]|uniref:TraB/GumN family protein n=1 Tax=Brevibacillus reuszeri TaxID=54915 RepID=UPI0028A23C6A|nr:TraB/GumN family protein [Brevibacillus reuszeri]